MSDQRTTVVDQAELHAALRLLDLVDPRVVVEWASGAVSRGEDASDALLALAGMSGRSGEEVDRALGELNDALGLRPMTRHRAGRLAAAGICTSLGQGDRSAISAARDLWQLANLVPECADVLRPFVALASEWDDDPENREIYEEEIRSRALLLATTA